MLPKQHDGDGDESAHADCQKAYDDGLFQFHNRGMTTPDRLNLVKLQSVFVIAEPEWMTGGPSYSVRQK